MNKVSTIQFIFRQPVFPVIIEIDGFLVAANSAQTLSLRLLKIENFSKTTYNAVDGTGEGWSFLPQHWAISPLTLKKRWKKIEIIRLYNERKNRGEGDSDYSEKSLSAKKLSRIINDIFQRLDTT